MKPDGPPAGGKSRNKKILVYAGVAGAVLALLVILKKRKESSSSSSSEESNAATYTSAPSGIPATGETGNLSSFEASLTEQLPGAIAAGVQAGLSSNTPAQSNGLPETISALSEFLGSIRSSNTGEQTGGGAQLSPSSAGPSTILAPAPAAPAAPTPVASAPPKTSSPAPAGCPSSHPIRGPHGCYHNGKCGNGCEGHFYQSGTSECQTKTGGKCHW